MTYKLKDLNMKKFSIVLLLVLCSACWKPASHHIKEVEGSGGNLTVGTVQKEIYKGMSAGDVASVLGSPNIVTRGYDGGETWIYDKVSSTASYSKSSTGLPAIIFGMNEAGARASSDKTLTVVIKFDKYSKVKDFSYIVIPNSFYP